ncbi:MAG: hypothetical protein AAFO94_05170 [Bacteroidota bacterium]
MKKSILLSLGLLFFFSLTANAQKLGRRSVQKVLERGIEKKVPKLINKKAKAEEFKLSSLNINGKNVKVKGKFKLKHKGQNVFDDSLSFKGKVTAFSRKPKIRHLKVHIPGDRFLWFKRYRRIV